MKVYVCNGKFGVIGENNRIVVQPIYSSTGEMVQKDEFFKAETQAAGSQNREAEMEII